MFGQLPVINDIRQMVRRKQKKANFWPSNAGIAAHQQPGRNRSPLLGEQQSNLDLRRQHWSPRLISATSQLSYEIIMSLSLDHIQRAWQDVSETTRRWQVWYFIGLQEIKLRYRRSVIGPFWITLSMAITIAWDGAGAHPDC